jgi:UPF0271 protein
VISVDLNADLGESFGSWRMGDDAAMLEIVTSANIACGFHAGDPMQMSETVELAHKKNVAIGAHPGFRDMQGFGRRRIHGISAQQLAADLIYQIGALQAIAHARGAVVSHIKLHGALANMACEDSALAQNCMQTFAQIDKSLHVVVMPGTELEKAAKTKGNPMINEIFADRAYNDDGTLVSRGWQGAMIYDPQQAADRIIKVLESGKITSVNGVNIPVKAQTICVHGDNPDSVKMASIVRERLEKAGIRVEKFHS